MKQVAPGIMVSDDVNVSIAHPNPCWIIRNVDDTACFQTDGSVLVFSSQEKAEGLVAVSLDGAVVTGPMSWDDLVDRFADSYSDALIDPTGEPGFFGNAPLLKGI